jgi:hypothetical protein
MELQLRRTGVRDLMSTNSMSASLQSNLQDRFDLMRDEIDNELDSICAECEDKAAAEIRAIFKRRLIPLIQKHFPGD